MYYTRASNILKSKLERKCYRQYVSGAKLPSNYLKTRQDLLRVMSDNQVITDVRTVLYGQDASFYRYIPKIVVNAKNELEISHLLKIVNQNNTPVTFRAAGTSLSGQSVTDSILVRTIPSHWSKIEIKNNGNQINLQPGVIGGNANRRLQSYGKKIGPDPASISSAMIGGIVANNSSGMCCGTTGNSYNTIKNIRVVLSDGTVLDTSSEESKKEFSMSHGRLLGDLERLGNQVRSNENLRKLIEKKYSIKNTTGYSLNALVDFEDPFDILQHLMVGSEGTLGFISSVELNTLDDLPYKSSALLLYDNLHDACKSVEGLKYAGAPVDAIEVMDIACLRSVEHLNLIKGQLKENTSAVLTETRSKSKKGITDNISVVNDILSRYRPAGDISFTSTPEENASLWELRKGIYPYVGSKRPESTSLIIEDVAVDLTKLANLGIDLQELFKTGGYKDAIFFGHARDGNMHIVFSQAFDNKEDIERYRLLMDNMSHLVHHKYNGSLKAEHGTGRNMAPYVELEWGTEAYQVMKKIKEILDPNNILNPGVILNNDPHCHVKNLKSMPKIHPIIDKCVECGFCEKHCPSKELTLTPKQRIIAIRELNNDFLDSNAKKELRKSYDYLGDYTCAADGMCETACPVKINTGSFIKIFRSEKRTKFQKQIAKTIGNNFELSLYLGSSLLNLAATVGSIIGRDNVYGLSKFAKKIVPSLPLWNPNVPSGASSNISSINVPLVVESAIDYDIPDKDYPDTDRPSNNISKVIYFTCCVNRLMGPHPTKNQKNLPEVLSSLLSKGGYSVISPSAGLCCGMAFSSKGFEDTSKHKMEELKHELESLTKGEKTTILFDMSPCTYHFKVALKEQNSKLEVLEIIDFVDRHLSDKLVFSNIKEKVYIHTPCSSRKMGLTNAFKRILQKCANEVIESNLSCCGMAGDKGLFFPELPRSAISTMENEDIAKEVGYSTSRTCELAMSTNTGVVYSSVAYLLDECSEPANVQNVQE